MAEQERRNPFDGVVDYFSEITRMREVGVHGRAQPQDSGERSHASAWVPATDIFARGEDLVIRVEVAGVRTQDVDISLAHGSLSISGVRHPDVGAAEVQYYVHERFVGEFRRVITLPETVQPSQLRAKLFDGLVEITVAGAAAAPGATRIVLADAAEEPEFRDLS